MSAEIVVRGAREHNLQNLTLKLPRDKLVVITGLSGSGKSSLAFDTIYAEGQRRYVESLSAYARQFLEQNRKPDVDSIDGLSPAIAIEQKSVSRNPRSTVGTLTEIYDYLRVLYARIGVPHCYKCGRKIASQTVQQIVDTILGWPDRTKFLVLSPIVRGRKGEYRKELARFQKEGFVRVRIDGEVLELDQVGALDKNKKHDIDLVVDRLVVKSGVRQRLTDSIELALRRGDGLVRVAPLEGEEQLFSENFACIACGISFSEMSPRAFSFNSPYGACVSCDGLGHAMELDEDKVVPDAEKSIEDGAIKPWSGRWASFYGQQLLSVAKHYDGQVDVPWRRLKKRFRQALLYGSGDEVIRFVYEREGRRYRFNRPFEGVIPNLQRRLKETQSDRGREEIQSYMTSKPCHACHGARLKPESLAVKVGEKSISDVCGLPVDEAMSFFTTLELSERDAKIARRVLREVRERLSFLEAVGLSYLNLDRGSRTLSGGEAQRIRLATQIGSALQGVIYVLDEPSIGLHQRDNGRLLRTLQRLRDLGNTVLVVEHDEETIRTADYVVDMGPGAGVHGGKVVVAGAPDVVAACPKSLTGDYLSGRLCVSVPEPQNRRQGNGAKITLKGASGNNLKNVTVSFPLGVFTCVTGVSGSGKSTLINETLYAGLARRLHGSGDTPAAHQDLAGLDAIDKVIDIDQSPIGRTPRSNPATYTQVFAHIRELFAGLPESRARGYKAGRYSFNVKGGRCEACEGDGILRIEMHFLPDVFVTCEQCKGKRYNRETLDVLYKGKSIADVLKLTVDEAADFLGAVPPIKRKLDTLQAVGLGYIELGQSATTLSGGEAQRVKLSRELSRRATGRTLYILDEPTTGLHFHDVARLLEVLHSLVDSGNTVVVIEHNLDVIKTADHVIDLGPEGGQGGGVIVAQGTPEEVAHASGSHTGAYLRPLLKSAKPPSAGARRRRRSAPASA